MVVVVLGREMVKVVLGGSSGGNGSRGDGREMIKVVVVVYVGGGCDGVVGGSGGGAGKGGRGDGREMIKK